MKYYFISQCFTVVYMLLPFVLLICLIWKYKSTGDKGFLFLILALVVWPICDVLFEHLQDVYWRRALAGEKITLFPFSLISVEDEIIGPGFRNLFAKIRLLIKELLLLVAILMLARRQVKPRTEKKLEERMKK